MGGKKKRFDEFLSPYDEVQKKTKRKTNTTATSVTLGFWVKALIKSKMFQIPLIKGSQLHRLNTIRNKNYAGKLLVGKNLFLLFIPEQLTQ